MLDINSPLDNLKEQLENNSELVELGFHISQSECVNENLNLAPWLGIYIRSVKHDPKTIGTTQRRWKGDISLLLVVQATSLMSGEDCSQVLETYIKAVINAVFGDTTFGNSIDLVNKLDVDYAYDNKEGSTLYFQEAFLTIEVETEHES